MKRKKGSNKLELSQYFKGKEKNSWKIWWDKKEKTLNVQCYKKFKYLLCVRKPVVLGYVLIILKREHIRTKILFQKIRHKQQN